MSDCEALTAALGYADAGRIAVTSTENFGPLETLYAAARERLAQLPEKCGSCEGAGILAYIDGRTLGTGETAFRPCRTCHGSGKVYPAELVERVFEVIWNVPENKRSYREWMQGVAVAVLDALGETGAVDHNLIEHDPDDLNYRGDPNYHKRMD